MSVTLINGFKYFTGFLAFLTLILPYYINFATYSPFLLRPILNIAWAFIFGTHIWYLFFAAEDLFAADEEEGYYFGKRRDGTLTEGADECNKFLCCTLFFNALIVVTTRGLAPYHKYVHCCSVTSLLATFANAFLVPKSAPTVEHGFPFSLISSPTCSRILSLFTCAPLFIYSLM